MKTKIIQIALMLMVINTQTMAYETNPPLFFTTLAGQRMVSVIPMDRIICGTNNTEETIDYSKAEYEINSNTLQDQIVRIFNYDILEIYSDDYMYDYPDPEDPNTAVEDCYTGEVDETYFGVMQDGAQYSRQCYKQSFIRNIGGKEILCLKAEVMKKVFFVPKSLERVEQLVRDYCPIAVDPTTGVIDEQKAKDCVEQLDYSQMAGNLKQ